MAKLADLAPPRLPADSSLRSSRVAGSVLRSNRPRSLRRSSAHARQQSAMPLGGPRHRRKIKGWTRIGR